MVAQLIAVQRAAPAIDQIAGLHTPWRATGKRCEVNIDFVEEVAAVCRPAFRINRIIDFVDNPYNVHLVGETLACGSDVNDCMAPFTALQADHSSS
jgi:hypothetical protein